MKLFYFSFLFLSLALLAFSTRRAALAWTDRQSSRDILADLNAKRKENLKKILALLQDHHRITNNDVEHLLGVSNSTAWRYLEELEKDGHLKQVGKTGQLVYYKKTQRLT